jgi:hypothetical protein
MSDERRAFGPALAMTVLREPYFPLRVGFDGSGLSAFSQKPQVDICTTTRQAYKVAAEPLTGRPLRGTTINLPRLTRNHSIIRSPGIARKILLSVDGLRREHAATISTVDLDIAWGEYRGL